MPRLERSGGVSLFYDVRGEGSPLLLLNGMSQSTANWMSQRRELAPYHQVITWDARGQGQSSVGAAPLTLEVHVEDIAALLDHLGLERVTLCGFSFGARLAVAFAARRPERVERVILTSAGARDTELRRLIVRSWYEVLQRGGVEAMTWCALPHILGERFLERYKDQLAGMVRASVQRNSAEGLQALLASYATFPPIALEASRVHAPTLLITSPLDPLVSVDGAKALLEALPANARHVILDGYGHTLPIEAPEAWRAAVLEFMA